MSYPAGSVVKLTGTFTDASGAAMDPTTVKATIQEPAGTKTVYVYGQGQIQKSAVGIYYLLLDTTGKAGVWLYRWHSEGTGQAASTDDHFTVSPPAPS